ncbi:MAG: hypothetical protein ACYCZ1_10470 [Candidatus Humimicrobiaceae bacterium]
MKKVKHNIRLIKRSPAEELNVDRKTIERDLKLLKKQNKIILLAVKIRLLEIIKLKK